MIPKAKILKKVKTIVADKLKIDEELITPKSRFKEDLGADSLDTVDIIVQIEKDFDFTISEDVVYKINTVGEAINHIKKSGKIVRRKRLKSKNQ